MTKILFVDIDETLTTTISGHTFKQSPHDIKPLPGAQKAITYFANLGFKIFGVSNQGGCDTINKKTGLPFKSINDAALEMVNTIKLFPEVESIIFCPSMKGEYVIRVDKDTFLNLSTADLWEGLYRKPDIGMINEIEYIYSTNNVSRVNKTQSLFVGDRPEDQECADKSGYPFQWADVWRTKYGV